MEKGRVCDMLDYNDNKFRFVFTRPEDKFKIRTYTLQDYNDAYFEDEDSMDVNISMCKDNGLFSMDELDDIESESMCDVNMIELSSDSLDMVEYCGVELDSVNYNECGWTEFSEINRQNRKFDIFNKSNYDEDEWSRFCRLG